MFVVILVSSRSKHHRSRRSTVPRCYHPVLRHHACYLCRQHLLLYHSVFGLLGQLVFLRFLCHEFGGVVAVMDFICQWSPGKLSIFPVCASVAGPKEVVNLSYLCFTCRSNIYLPSHLLADAMQQTSSEKVEFPKGDTWSIHKFGGTCVGSSERIRNVAHVIINDDSERKLVVVSAMSKVTNMMYDLVCKAQSRDDSYIAALDAVLERHKLTALDLLEGDDLASFLLQLHDDINNLKAMLRAIYIAGHATESFTDFVVGHGELWSAQMLASLVRKVSGMDCNWMDTREVLIVNPSGSNQVDPDYLESEKRLEKWFLQNPSKTVIATGFIASTPQNIPTTLKSDGSDFSAAIMGALFRARQVTIWTDVDGVCSADPRKVSEAVVLKTLSYQEAWEMSYFGANVLHPRTIIPVMQYDIPIIIRNIFNLSAPGTMICQPSVNEFEDGQRLESYVKGFATIDNLALVNVEGTGMVGVPGTASAIFGAVKDVGANVIMISQASSEHSICFAVPEKEVKAVAEVLQSRFRQALDAERLSQSHNPKSIHHTATTKPPQICHRPSSSQVAVISNCSILAAVGQKMASTPGVSATLFNALAKANINVRAIAQGCSEYNITVVVKQEDCVKALRAVHSRFYFSKTTIAVGIVGSGLIGGTLLDQLRDQAAVLKEQFNIDLRVMGITGSRRMLLSDTGIDLSRWRDLQKVEGEVADLEKFVHNVHGNHFIPNTVLVDCTADSGVVSRYYEWLRRGIHVITPNKKANSGPLEQYLKLRALQRQSYTHYFYEATVGAGLPIISTLQGLLETGDKILRIEGIFSGTLSYIFNNFIGTRAFSEVVAEAKEAGFTEPDPRDDFSGTDVARKAYKVLDYVVVYVDNGTNRIVVLLSNGELLLDPNGAQGQTQGVKERGNSTHKKVLQIEGVEQGGIAIGGANTNITDINLSDIEIIIDDDIGNA
ncbi:hypothetical protein TEA_014353 [Camellia sinensis var. sinensis]|uniref:ACT domain-containing protein n=1 Tax=Camellia sinensis var. sinensis TaxID=542762 RepID=A0A4S4E8G8_CAMSN|nr:hypothetical protein TEA_014353 [Camellia sinensis var. sinensis]